MGRGIFTKPTAGAQVDWTHPLARGLVAAWLFNQGELLDYTKFGANGVNNGSTVDVGKFGGSARKFVTASTQFINIGTPPRLNLTSEMTFVGWVNPSAANLGNTQFIVGANNAGGAARQNSLRVSSSSTLQFLWANAVMASAPTTLLAGRWVQVGAKRSGVAGAWTATIYLNGKVNGTGTTATNPSAQTTFAIARDGASVVANGTFGGSMDHLLVYNRALLDTEVAQLYGDPFCLIQASHLRRYFFPQVQPGGFRGIQTGGLIGKRGIQTGGRM